MKKKEFAIFMVLFTIFFPSWAWAQYGGGSGTEDNPYIITTPAHMQELEQQVNNQGIAFYDTYFRMEADLDFTGINTFRGIGTECAPTVNSTGYLHFAGYFDGNGHTIRNLQMRYPNKNHVGLFSVASSLATIKDLTIESSVIEGKADVGAIVGFMDSDGVPTDYGVRGCKVAEDVSVIAGESVGGIMGGTAGRSVVIDCVFLGTVSGSKWVGAITGCSYVHYVYTQYGITSVASDEQSWNCYIGGNCTTGAVGVEGSADGTDEYTTTKHVTTINTVGNVAATVLTTPTLYFKEKAYYDCASKIKLNLIYTGTLPTGYTQNFTSSSGTLTAAGNCHELTLPSVVTHVDIAVASTPPVRDIAYDEWIHISIAAQEYTGSALTPDVVVTDTQSGTAVTLQEGTDYRLLFRDDLTNPGDHEVFVVGIGNYGGQTSAMFNIYHPAFNEGSGTADEPFIIRTIDDMDQIATRVSLGDNLRGLHFRLVNDLDYTGKTYNAIGNTYTSFEGIFNGYYHTISHVTSQEGLFYAVKNGGVVENLTLDDSSISGIIGIGGIVNYLEGTVQGCHTTGNVSISSQYGGCGGIVAAMNMGEIINCTNAASVSSNGGTCGGIVGSAEENATAITNCINTGRVNASSNCGGIIAICNSEHMEFIGCFNYGEVSTKAENCGGIVGKMNDCQFLTGCVNEGTIRGRRYVGGIVGTTLSIFSGTISDCLNLGDVECTLSNQYGGGIVGVAESIGNGMLSNNYYATGTNVGGVAGSDIFGQAMHGWVVSHDTNLSLSLMPNSYDKFIGIQHDGVLYLGAGETGYMIISRGMAFSDYTLQVSAGTLTPVESEDYGDELYKLTMPTVGQDVTISLATPPTLVLLDDDTQDFYDNARRIADNEDFTGSVRLQDRTLSKDGTWNTLCLPFNLTLEGSVLEGATLKELDVTGTDVDGTTLNLRFKVATAVEAGKPYIIKWEGDGTDKIVSPVFPGVTINNTVTNVWNAGQSVGFISSYDAIDGITSSWPDTSVLLGKGNTLHYAANREAQGAFRAFVQVDNTKLATMPTAYFIDFGNGETASGDLHMLGDANGDGQVTLADAVAIVNYLLGTPPASFKTVPADVTQNGFITISDAVAVVYMVME